MPIHILAPEHAQKIAAGEVVERPSNIIKELLENSIDAGSTHIELAVTEGGKRSIVITDNGSGMSEQDALLCFERHATSKLTVFDDLLNIQTFGFRGEALATVCGVARVTLTTKLHGAVEGIQLVVEEGKVLSQSIIGCAAGTKIEVNDLFYNIPVRKKFLKTTATEWNQISSLFKAFCLTYPQIHFTLLHENTEVLNCPPVATLSERVDQLFDPHLSKSLLSLVPLEDRGVQIEGGITNPHYSRYDRNGLYFFVNKRLVKNYGLAKAVMKGIGPILPPDKYPCAILQITIEPHLVDINIHPKKEEVLFLHPQLVEQLITESIRKTLEQHLSARLQESTTPVFWMDPHSPLRSVEDDSFASNTTLQPVFWSKPHSTLRPIEDDIFVSDTRLQPSFASPAYPIKSVHNKPLEAQSFTTEQASYRIVGQVNATYIILDHPDGMLMIDQHAAHERILYERFKERFGNLETIELLFPPIIELPAQGREQLMAYTTLLASHGIIIEQVGEHAIKVKAIPVYAKNVPLKELLEQMLSWIAEVGILPPEELLKKITEKLRAQLACKAAVKAGDILSREQMEQLIQDLSKTESRFSCPHGRPTQWLLSTYEIEKKFKRVG